MKKSITLIVATLLSAIVAAADEQAPRYEAFLGYTTLRTDLQNNTPVLDEHFDHFFMNGGSGQFIYNFNKWFSGVADLGAVHRGNVGVLDVEDRTAFFLFGPRVSYRKSSHWTPYFQVLFGAAEQSATKQLSVVTGPGTPEPPVVTPHDPLFPGPGADITAQVQASKSAFAMTAGGGLDVRVSKRFTLRPIAADYMLTRFNNLVTGNTANQNGLRLSAGIIFTFGAE